MKYIKVKTIEPYSCTVYINPDHIDCVEEVEVGDTARIKLNGGNSRIYETIESAEMIIQLIEMACSEFETNPAVRRENKEEPAERNE